MSEILGDKLNIIYEDTLLEITPELMKKTIIKQSKEIERLNNIIKEVREKLLCYGETFDNKIHQEMQKELLEILDKESEK